MHSGFAKSTALFLLLMVGFALPGHAQNNKPIRSGDFYEDRASSSDSGGSITITFAQSPTDKFLNVTNVACDITLASTQILVGLIFNVGTASGLIDLNRPLSIRGNAIPETLGSAPKFYSIVTNQIFYKVGNGRYPSIRVGTGFTGSPSIDVSCVIVGNLTDS